MSFDDDYSFALKLQNELNGLDEFESNVSQNQKRKADELDLNATQNIVHPEWETVDPTPDIFSLFGAFDLKFFQGKLKCVELEWSKRMYQCAGICYQRRNRLGMSITIRLSEPLLKLRSRRNLIETLLHEMIHAYLFVLNIREGNGGHGPNFVKIMQGINKTAGTNITVYHTFHDEVALYRTHIWRCNGICQHRKPFYGWVKRTCNRAPGPYDSWFAKHQQTCGGVFQKISQPEPKQKAKKAKKSDTLPKITDWMNTGNVATLPKPNNNTGGFNKMNGGTGSRTVLVKPTTQNRPPPTVTSTNTSNDTSVGGNLSNVVGFRDLNGESTVIKRPPSFPTGSGNTLGSSTPLSTPTASGLSASENIRNVWANKFATPSQNSQGSGHSNDDVVVPAQDNRNLVTEASSQWEEIDDDLLVHNVQNAVIEIADGDSDQVNPTTTTRTNSSISQLIKQELLDDIGAADADIVMIDDEFDEALRHESFEILSDTSVINDLFGTDTLMRDFDEINNVIMNDPENKGNANKEIISCPICGDRMAREELNDHLDGCAGITVKIMPKRSGTKSVGKNPLPFYKNEAKPSTSKQTLNGYEIDLMRQAGYSQTDIEKILKENQEEDAYNKRISDEVASERRQRLDGGERETIVLDDIDLDDAGAAAISEPVEKHPCPVCNTPVDANKMNEHLDVCLEGSFD